MSRYKNHGSKTGSKQTKNVPIPTIKLTNQETGSISQAMLMDKIERHKTVYDENLLERVRTQWQFGDWESLTRLQRDTIKSHPERAQLAVFAAAGYLQTNNSDVARQLIALAREWGCSKKFLSQILVAGVHNSLGRASAIIGQQSRSIKHFENVISIGTPNSEIRLLSNALINQQYAQINQAQITKATLSPSLTPSSTLPSLTTLGDRHNVKSDRIQVGIVTGIPRSGTSLFSTLLNNHENIVCFNEIFYEINSIEKNLYEAGNKILLGEQVRNKFAEDGNLTTDTMSSGIVKSYYPVKNTSNLLVFSKVNVPYLMQLQVLINLGMPIFVIVRDPLYCLASWSSIRSASIPEAMVGPDKENLHKRWSSINFKSNEKLNRQAELWNYLASIIIKLKDHVNIIKYEDVIKDPADVMNHFYENMGIHMTGNSVEVFDGNIEERYDEETFIAIKDAIAKYAPNRLKLGYT